MDEPRKMKTSDLSSEALRDKYVITKSKGRWMAAPVVGVAQSDDADPIVQIYLGRLIQSCPGRLLAPEYTNEVLVFDDMKTAEAYRRKHYWNP
jgi:hypothetical protein